MPAAETPAASSTVKTTLSSGRTRSSSSSSSFRGFEHHEFSPALASIVTLGLLGLLFQGWPLALGSFLSMFFLLLSYKWYHIHGLKLTRREIIFFDERNLLEISSNAPPDDPSVLAEDSATPAAGPPDWQKPGLSTIWQALFCDETELNMQEFYRRHYGPVWNTAERNKKTLEAMRNPPTSTRTALEN